MVKIEISNRLLYTFIALVVTINAIAISFAFGGNTPNVIGHSSGEVEVTVGGVQKTLQTAIDAGDLGGGICNWAGWKCDCTDSNVAGTWVHGTVGLECVNGNINNIRQIEDSIGSPCLAKPGPTVCDIYTIDGI